MQVEPVTLPEPPGMARTPWVWRVVLGIVFALGFGLFMAFLGVRAIAEGRLLHLFFYVPATATFLLPVYWWLGRAAHQDVPTFEQFVAEHGYGEFRVDRDVNATVAYLAATGVVIVGAATFAVGSLSGTLEFDLVGRQQTALPIGVGMLGVFVSWSFLAVAIRGTSGWLRLSPAGIDRMEQGVVRKKLAWDEIRDITMEPQQRLRAQRIPMMSRAWLVRRDESKGATSIPLNWPMGNRATYWLIRFYLTHPELRDELGDDRVVERIQAGRILDR